MIFFILYNFIAKNNDKKARQGYTMARIKQYKTE